MNRLPVPVVAAALAAAPALAQDAPPPESDLAQAIEVVARRYEAPAATAVPKVTSLGERDVDRRQARSVAELLTEVPGAQVLQDGPHGQTSRIYLRGAASNQTLVVIDGIPQNDATAGGLYDFNDLSTAGVERVDVLAGSYGVLYGSEAIGGVVSVTTRRGRGPARGFVQAEGGSFGTHREVFGAGGGDDEFDLWLTVSNDSTNGERRREAFDANELSLRTGFALTETLRADLTFRGVRSKLESPFDFPAFGSTVLPEDPNIERTRDTASAGATLTHTLADRLTTRLTLSYFRADNEFVNGPDRAETFDPDGTPGSGDETTELRDELDAENVARDWRLRLASTAAVGRMLGWKPRSEGGVEMDLTAGGELLDQSSSSDTTSPNFGAPGTSTTRIDRSIDTDSVFALAEMRFPDLGPVRGGVFSAGARHDESESFGGESSPFAGARLEFAPTGTALRGSWGEGFRAPQPAELDDPYVGNEALGPETSESLDGGVSQPLLDGRLDLGATWFRLETDDLIAFDPAATSPSRPYGKLVNFRRTRTTGCELTAAADAGAGFRVRAAYTRQNPRDLDTGRPLPNRSREILGAGVSWERGDLLVSLDALWTTRFPDQGGEYTYPEPDERRAPGRRAIFNLTARWRVSESVTVFGRVENLFDDDWVATPTAPAGPPLGVFAGLRIDF